MKHKTLFFMLLLVFGAGYATQIGGESSFPFITKDSISQEFSKATLTVTPHTAMSPIAYYEQEISVCNNEASPQYLFVDYNFNNKLKDNGTLFHKQKIVTNYTRTIADQSTCYNEDYASTYYNNVTETTLPTTKTRTICQNKSVQQTEESITYVPYKVSHATGVITGKHHYLSTDGLFTQPFQCQEFKVGYRPNERNGKWDFRTWASSNNDWSCINDQSCTFDYTLDPWFNTTCASKRNISMTNLIGTKTINLTLGAHLFNTNLTFNQSNITFVDASETSTLNFLIDYINASGNTAQQEIKAFVNISNNDSIWMYQDCGFPVTQEVRTTGNTTPVMFGYWNFDDDLQGWSAVGTGACALQNITAPILNGNRMGAQSLNATDNAGSRQGCKSGGLFRIGIEDLNFTRYEAVITNFGTIPNNAEFYTSSIHNPTGIGDYQVMSRFSGGSWDFANSVGFSAFLSAPNDTQLGNFTRVLLRSNWSDTTSNTTGFGRLNGERVGNSGFPYRNNVANGIRTLIFGGSGQGGWFVDDIKVWAQNNATIITLGSQENLTPAPSPAFECILNSFSIPNATAFEYDAQTSLLNLTWNNTNVSDIDVSFFINGQNISTNISSAITPNGTALNNTLFRATYITPIIAANATNITSNWTVICYLNNGSIRQLNTTPNIGQVIQFAHTVQRINFTSPVPEQSRQNYTLNLTLFKSIINTNATFFYQNIERRNATLNTTSLVGNDNLSFYNVTKFQVPISIINNTAHNITFELRIEYGNGSIKIINTTIGQQNLTFAIFPNTIVINPQGIIEGDTFLVNTTLNKESDGFSTTLIIEYNNTNTSATLVSNSSTFEEWHTNITTVFVNNLTENKTILAKWMFQSNDGTTRNITTNSTILIDQIAWRNCNAGNTNHSLNITLFVEGNITNPIPMTTVQSFYTLKSANATPNNINRSFGLNFTSTPTLNYCKASGNQSYSILAFDVYYQATGFESREFHEVTNPRSNFTGNLLRNISLFTIASGSGTSVTITLIDGNDNVLRLYTITAQKKNILNNTFAEVDSRITNFDGQVQMNLETGSEDIYRFIVRDPNGNIIETTEETVIISTSFTIRVFLEELVVLQNIMGAANFQAVINYTSSGAQVNMTWNDTNSIASQVCLKILFFNTTTNSVVVDICSSNTTGGFNQTLGNRSGGQVQAIGYFIASSDGISYVFQKLDIDLSGRTNIFGTFGLFISMMFFGIMLFIAISTQNIPLTLTFGLLGLIVSVVLNFNLIGFSGGVITLIIIYVIYIIRSKS
jgi:hypothetical protein